MLATIVECELVVDGIVDSWHVLLEDSCVALASSTQVTKASAYRTCLLIHRKHGDLSTGTPRRNLSNLINEPLNVGLGPVVFPKLENNTKVVGLLLQCHDIPLDILRGAVVIFNNRGNLVTEKIPHLARLDVQRKEAMQYGKDEDVNLV